MTIPSIISKTKKPQCKIVDCENDSRYRGYCPKHYMAKKKEGLFTDKVCSVPGCEKPFYAKDVCVRHYNQIKRLGKIIGDPKRTYRDKNDFIVIDGRVQISLFNQQCELVGYAYIDICDMQRVKKHKWHLTPKGYVETRYKKKLLKLHQLILNCSTGIDHVDRDRLNNIRANLRKADIFHNSWNIGITKRNKSGYKGVHQVESGSFAAQITHNKKTLHLGTFKKKEDAAKKYNEKAKEFFGNFAYLNNI